MKKIDWDTPAQYVKGVGPKIAKRLSKLGVQNIKDLIFIFPRDYEDRRKLKKIAEVKLWEDVIIRGKITKVREARTKNRFSIVKAGVADETGNITVVWFNQPFLLRVLKTNAHILVTGKIEQNPYSSKVELKVKNYELIDEKEDPRKIVPIFALTEGLPQKRMRYIVSQALQTYLEHIIDPIPQNIKQKYKLLDLRKAILNLHEPPDEKIMASARYRLVFDDFFIFQLGLGIRKTKFTSDASGIKLDTNGSLIEKFKASLPFKLTKAQDRVWKEIKEDLGSGRSMGRLLQGDVGSGKTIVAVFTILAAVESGYQAALMAPTEILASQHFERITKLLSPLGINVKLLISNLNRSLKEKTVKDLADSKIDIVVGTHALIEEKVKFGKLGVVVIDEQHRFGVLQRASLKQKSQLSPHLLVMTATPIPRTLALTLYGDLDRSVIDEMPPGRTPVKTFFVPKGKRDDSYEFIRQKIKEGRQVFVICPLIEESEESDLKAAKEEAKRLGENIFPEYKVGLIHGRLAGEEKDRVMKEFRAGSINILVSTTVIEVGIDIPNATIMVIEHAERFGLAALHQLRGRIGRGTEESFCFLFADPKTEEAKARIQAMLKSRDGFHLAEVDLRLRGPGEFYGVRQSGLPVFRIADIITDENILKIARRAAFELLAEDPKLRLESNRLLRQELWDRYGEFLELGILD